MSGARADLPTRFSKERQPVKNGRPRESRDKITTKFLYELAENFERNGKDAIQAVFETDPATYLKIAAAVLPKEIEIRQPMAEVDDDKLAKIIALLQAAEPPKEAVEVPEGQTIQ